MANTCIEWKLGFAQSWNIPGCIQSTSQSTVPSSSPFFPTPFSSPFIFILPAPFSITIVIGLNKRKKMIFFPSHYKDFLKCTPCGLAIRDTDQDPECFIFGCEKLQFYTARPKNMWYLPNNICEIIWYSRQTKSCKLMERLLLYTLYRYKKIS